MRQLTHEKLDVYQKSVEFLAISVQLMELLPKGNANLVDQLKRAAVSTILNIAEGAGRPTPADSRKHFAIARGSALECGAALDVLKVMQAGEPDLINKGKDVLVSVVSMLSKMCRR